MTKLQALMSQCNPFHHVNNDDVQLKSLNKTHRFETVLATIFVTLLTLPLLGIGGVAVYRSCKGAFSRAETAEASKTNEKVQVIKENHIHLKKNQKPRFEEKDGKEIAYIYLNSNDIKEKKPTTREKFTEKDLQFVKKLGNDQLRIIEDGGELKFSDKYVAKSEVKEFIRLNQDKVDDEGNNLLHVLVINIKDGVVLHKILKIIHTEILDPHALRALKTEKNQEHKNPLDYVTTSNYSEGAIKALNVE